MTTLTQNDVDALFNSGQQTEKSDAAHPLNFSSSEYEQSQLERILKLTVPVSVTLAERAMSVATILQMTVGTIVEFDVPFDAELSMKVANRPIASGTAVKIGEHFGMRLTKVGSITQRIDAMGGH